MDAAMLVLILVALVLLVTVLLRRPRLDPSDLERSVTGPLRADLDRLAERLDHGTQAAREELRGLTQAHQQEIERGFHLVSTTVARQSTDSSQQLANLTQLNEQKMNALREALDRNLAKLREENAEQLERMRVTVDEKLQGTLEQRLGESFKQVSERLEQVHKGLGEMQSLAVGVGDLKRVLTNVKARGTWGEMQLGNLLEQILTPDQYQRNVATRAGSTERVEFAVRLPGGGGGGTDGPLWLPIDAKFPLEDYQRLLDAQERADADAVATTGRELERRVLAEAKDIQEKYLDPPQTTDFGILYLPMEGLYAEVARRPGLLEQVQRQHRVNVAGPTTIAALLNALQMGFRTLAVQKRSSEVWALLGAVKTEFGKFGEALARTRAKLDEAAKQMEQAAVRSRAIERRLRDVQELPAADPAQALVAAGSDAVDGQLPEPVAETAPRPGPATRSPS